MRSTNTISASRALVILFLSTAFHLSNMVPSIAWADEPNQSFSVSEAPFVPLNEALSGLDAKSVALVEISTDASRYLAVKMNGLNSYTVILNGVEGPKVDRIENNIYRDGTLMEVSYWAQIDGKLVAVIQSDKETKVFHLQDEKWASKANRNDPRTIMFTRKNADHSTEYMLGPDGRQYKFDPIIVGGFPGQIKDVHYDYGVFAYVRRDISADHLSARSMVVVNGKKLAESVQTFPHEGVGEGESIDLRDFNYFPANGGCAVILEYSGNSGKRIQRLINGQDSPLPTLQFPHEARNVGQVSFSQLGYTTDGSRWWTTEVSGTSKKQSRIDVDGNNGPFYDSVNPVVFSDDGKSYAYSSSTNRQWAVVQDGRESAPLDNQPDWIMFRGGSNDLLTCDVPKVPITSGPTNGPIRRSFAAPRVMCNGKLIVQASSESGQLYRLPAFRQESSRFAPNTGRFATWMQIGKDDAMVLVEGAGELSSNAGNSDAWKALANRSVLGLAWQDNTTLRAITANADGTHFSTVTIKLGAAPTPPIASASQTPSPRTPPIPQPPKTPARGTRQPKTQPKLDDATLARIAGDYTLNGKDSAGNNLPEDVLTISTDGTMSLQSLKDKIIKPMLVLGTDAGMFLNVVGSGETTDGPVTIQLIFMGTAAPQVVLIEQFNGSAKTFRLTATKK